MVKKIKWIFLLIGILIFTGCVFTYEDEEMMKIDVGVEKDFVIRDVNGIIKMENPRFSLKLNSYKGETSKVKAASIILNYNDEEVIITPNTIIAEHEEKIVSVNLDLIDTAFKNKIVSNIKKSTQEKINAKFEFISQDTTMQNKKTVEKTIIYNYVEEKIYIDIQNEPKYFVKKIGEGYDVEYPKFKIKLENYEEGRVELKKVELTYDERKHLESFVILENLNFFLKTNETKELVISEIITEKLIQNLVTQTSYIEPVELKFIFVDKNGSDLMTITKRVNFVLEYTKDTDTTN